MSDDTDLDLDRALRELVDPVALGDAGLLWSRVRRRRRTHRVLGASAAVVVLLLVGGLVLAALGAGPDREEVAADGSTTTTVPTGERTTPQGVTVRVAPVDDLTVALTVDGVELLAPRTDRPLAPFDDIAEPVRDGDVTVAGAAALPPDASGTRLSIVSVVSDRAGAVSIEHAGEVLDRTTFVDGTAHLAIRTPAAEGEPEVTVRAEGADGSPAGTVTFSPFVREAGCPNPQVAGPEQTTTVPADPSAPPPTFAPANDPETHPFVPPLMAPCPN